MGHQDLPGNPSRKAAVSSGRVTRRGLIAAAGIAAIGLPAAAQEVAALERVKKRGSLSVAVYQDLPPFNVDGKGIDIDLAEALAAGLGLKLSLLQFPAGENIADDLRNAVWRGHYLGWGPADVMLHVPMDRPLIEANPQVDVFGAYYRERVALAWDREKGPAPESLGVLRGQPIAVAGLSLAGWLLAGADGGALRDKLLTQHADGAAAVRTLLAGQAVAAGGLASELESSLKGQSRYTVVPLPTPRVSREGWVVGCAVKRGATDLAKALQTRLTELQSGSEMRDIFAQYGVTWRA